MRSIRFAIDMIASRYKKFILSVLILIITLVLIMFTVMTYGGMNYSYISCENVFSSDMEDIGVIRIINYDEVYEQIMDFIKTSYEREEIKAIGNIVDYGADDPSGGELLALQDGHATDYQNTLEGLLEIKCMQTYVASLCSMELKKGKRIEELDYTDIDSRYLYLGSGYSDIEVGTEYTDNYGSKYIVAGIMKDEQRWINSWLDCGFNNDVLDYSEDCTYAVFDLSIGKDDVYSGSCWIVAEDGYSIEEAIDAAWKVGEEYGITFSYDTMMDMYEEEAKDTDALMSYLLNVMVIVIVSTILMMITLNIVIMMEDSKNYGAMYAVGFSSREINIMLLWRHIITSLCALIIAFGVCTYIAGIWFSNEDMSYMIKTILSHYVLPSGVVFVTVIVVISYLVTYVILKKMSPVKLLKRKF